ncbi:MAG: metal ABC transporter permease [Verrucomicrobiales bacterium]|nr:metal ABC transporter permease [Verrucomicrobiales bacterium]
MGVACGILGTFLVVRRLALVGDTLSHAVLPGVAAGFLWNQTKNPLAIFVGAVVAGLLGTMVASAIRRTTRLKEDTALGLVLAGFYAVGICLVTMIQRLPTGNKSGIDKFLFGQAAAISAGDLSLMAVVTVLVLVVVVLFYKELLVTSFDPAFARSTGFPVRLIQDGLMLLLAFAVVSALQAVGVVLVSAMLITPAAAAYLLTDRLRRMLVIASTIGAVTGVAGCFLSFLGNSLPTGPMMVLATSVVFAAAFLFAPRHGLAVRWAAALARQRRIGRENSLKAFYHIQENRRFERDGVTLRELATHRRETLDDADRQAKALVRHGFAVLEDDGQLLRLTAEGKKRAAELVRNHRLWELYLTHAARYAADHVHDDAEKIEHVLGEEVVWELERKLNFANTDPHGRPIPTPKDWQVHPGRGAAEGASREGGAA